MHDGEEDKVVENEEQHEEGVAEVGETKEVDEK
jgi:hypothetical protein